MAAPLPPEGGAAQTGGPRRKLTQQYKFALEKIEDLKADIARLQPGGAAGSKRRESPSDDKPHASGVDASTSTPAHWAAISQSPWQSGDLVGAYRRGLGGDGTSQAAGRDDRGSEIEAASELRRKLEDAKLQIAVQAMQLKKEHVAEMARYGADLSASRSKAGELERQLLEMRRETAASKAASDKRMRQELDDTRRSAVQLRLKHEALEVENAYLRGLLIDSQKFPARRQPSFDRNGRIEVSAPTATTGKTALKDGAGPSGRQLLRDSALQMLRASGWSNDEEGAAGCVTAKPGHRRPVRRIDTRRASMSWPSPPTRPDSTELKLPPIPIPAPVGHCPGPRARRHSVAAPEIMSY